MSISEAAARYLDVGPAMKNRALRPSLPRQL